MPVWPPGLPVGPIPCSFPISFRPAGFHRIFSIWSLGDLDFYGPRNSWGLTDFHPLTHAFFWSMLLNIGLFVGVSLLTAPSADEEEQVARFVDVYLVSPEVGLEPRTTNLPEAPQFIALAAKFVGQGKAGEALQEFIAENNLEDAPSGQMRISCDFGIISNVSSAAQ